MKKRIPDGYQIFLILFLTISSLVLVGPLISALVFVFMDIPDVQSIDPNEPRIGYVMVGSGMIAMFLTGFLLFLRFSGENWKSLIKRNGIKLNYIGLTLLVLLVGWFIAEGLYYVNHWIIEQFPAAGYLEAEAELNHQLESWFNEENRSLFPLAILIFAVFPAIVEELIFRGILMKKLMVVSGGQLHFGVIVSAMLFAALHMQAWNLLPMIALGMLLGYLYHFTKDIRYNMLLHFLYNAVQIVVMFYFPAITI